MKLIDGVKYYSFAEIEEVLIRYGKKFWANITVSRLIEELKETIGG